METNFKYSVITASIDEIGDRYCMEGYKGYNISLDEKIDKFSKCPWITGLELCYDPANGESDFEKIKRIKKNYGYEIPVINTTLSAERKWKNGSLSALNNSVRNDAIIKTKEAIDYAEAVGAGIVNIWLGQDGFDYSFQTDYKAQWLRLIDSIKELAQYKPNIKLTLEPKPKEPRKFSLIDSTSSAVLMAKHADKGNVGVCIDIGHELQGGRNIVQCLELCSIFNKLWNIHVNDNYGSWDDDMIPGSVHFVQYIEMFYSLRKIGYKGYISVDIFPFRENSIDAAIESVRYLNKIDQMVDYIGLETIDTMIGQWDMSRIMSTIRDKCFK